MDNDRIEMNGYSFHRDMGLEAKKEQSAIEYLTKQLDMNEPSTVMKVYRQIISQKLFHTQVGYDFLKGLQNYLVTNPDIDNTQIDTIEIDSPEEMLKAINLSRAKRGERAVSAVTDEMSRDLKKFKALKRRSGIFLTTTIILIAMVAAMFVITLTAKVPTVLNYRENLNDYYSSWDQALTERENALRKQTGEGTGFSTPLTEDTDE